MSLRTSIAWAASPPYSHTQQVTASYPLRWRHNDHAGVSNHQPHVCLLNRLFRRRSKKTSKLRVTGFCAGNSPGPVNSPHKGPVTRNMFPFDDVIMPWCIYPIFVRWLLWAAESNYTASTTVSCATTWRCEQNGRYFANDIIQLLSPKHRCYILTKIS